MSLATLVRSPVHQPSGFLVLGGPASSRRLAQGSVNTVWIQPLVWACSSSSKIGIANRKIRPFLRVTRKKMGRTSRVSASRHFETSGQKRGVAGEHEEPFQEPT